MFINIISNQFYIDIKIKYTEFKITYYFFSNTCGFLQPDNVPATD